MNLSNITTKFITPIDKVKWEHKMIVPSQIIWPYKLEYFGKCSNPFDPLNNIKKYLFILVDKIGNILVHYMTKEENENPFDYINEQDIALYEIQKEIEDEGFVYRLLKSKDS
jgi:hypothetical protein